MPQPLSQQGDWLAALSRLGAGRQDDPSQDRLWRERGPWWSPPAADRPVMSGEVQAVPFGSVADPVSQMALLLAPYLQRGVGGGMRGILSGLSTRPVAPGAIDRLPALLARTTADGPFASPVPMESIQGIRGAFGGGRPPETGGIEALRAMMSQARADIPVDMPLAMPFGGPRAMSPSELADIEDTYAAAIARARSLAATGSPQRGTPEYLDRFLPDAIKQAMMQGYPLTEAQAQQLALQHQLFVQNSARINANTPQTFIDRVNALEDVLIAERQKVLKWLDMQDTPR